MSSHRSSILAVSFCLKQRAYTYVDPGLSLLIFQSISAMKDATPLNVLFRGMEPVVDVLSIERGAPDQLASDSTVFTHVVPAGNETQVVIPSLLTGLPTDKIRPASDGRELTLHNPDTDTWQLFDAHQTIFQDALQAGYSTAS